MKNRSLTPLVYGFLGAYLLVSFFPILWLLLTSFKPTRLIQTWPPTFLFWPTLFHYGKVMTGEFARFFLNSALVATGSVVVSLLFGIPAAYALARFRFTGKDDLTFWILTTRMAPPFGFIVAFFLIFRTLGLLNTYLALILVYLTFNLSFVIWMLKGFIQEIPVQIEEAARVDGCSRSGTLVRIVVPLAAPAIISTAILSFILSWNEFFFALVLTGRDTRTVPVALSTFIGSMGIEWGNMAALSVLAILPIIALAMAVQKYLVRGLTMGAMKG